MAPNAEDDPSTTGAARARISSICSSASLNGEKGLPKASTSSQRPTALGDGFRPATSAADGTTNPSRRAASGGATGGDRLMTGAWQYASGTSRRTFSVSESPVSIGFQ